MEMLKMCDRGSKIEQAVDFSRKEGMPPGPGDVQIGREDIRQETEAGVQINFLSANLRRVQWHKIGE